MKDYRSSAQQYLADKGCKSKEQKYTALEVLEMLNEFTREQTKTRDVEHAEWQKCPMCEGFGVLDRYYPLQNTDQFINECPICDGAGFILKPQINI